ncbi:CoA transferase [Lachnospiraceae bacterium]|uniref:CaiB/BaiF CoA transferase family protein n=1 Tax=Extibacter sp. GGCC_0201 TaxID=2731209 RepID=UPI001AA13D06|nr:CoA transferase [Extibacter sp. GGCC_0201]MBO1720391.1 CoA transferase [Extibacter sp. GGCC_0201]BDF34493.1 CoA transferase [Lachnospiraceae bacterium]BDF38495.1 CoA transferase [Lachnospiraceae bacterium]
MKTKGALSGIRILDLSRVLAGPFCTMMLADLGAEVIKIEIPGKGDDSRSFGPFVNGESGYYMNVNRNKTGITLNLKKPEGKELFLGMVEKADIVVENYRPGVMEKLGLGYEVLKERNPKIIYGAVSGFGHYGPYTQRPGYDVIGQASCGLMSVTGWPDGGPTRVGTAMADSLAGYSLAIGLLAALQYRNSTGVGQKVDIGMMDSGIASMQIIYPIYTMGGRLPERIGNRYESNYPTDTFETKDGMMVIGAANDKLWVKLCEVMGRPQLALDERYDKNPKRVERYMELRPVIQEWTSNFTTKDAVELLLENGVPASPINNLAQVVEDPHAQAREMFVHVQHPVAGDTVLNGSQFKMTETNPQIDRPAPLLGQHNEEVYRDLLGLSAGQLEELEMQGIV